MTELVWKHPINDDIMVYRTLPNRLATCRLVTSITKPAQDRRLNAGIIIHGKAEIQKINHVLNKNIIFIIELIIK